MSQRSGESTGATLSTQREASFSPLRESIAHGRYRPLRLLGKGGIGVVYEADDTLLGRRVAVKVLRAPLADDPVAMKRFRREARAAAGFASPHIVSIIDFGDDGEAQYIAMELLKGKDLRRLLADEKRLDPARATAIGVQACQALQETHAKGVIHRDLKPANLFVSPRWDGTDHVKLLDFGVAKLSPAADATTGTTSGEPIGTVSYMAPEQARGDAPIDHRIDIYALGLILYEAVSGRHPRPAPDRRAVIHQILYEVPAPLAQDPNVPPALCAAIHRALAYAPEHRFQSAAEFSDALSACLRPSAPPYELRSRPRSSTRDRAMALVTAALAAMMMGDDASAREFGRSGSAKVSCEAVDSQQRAAPRAGAPETPTPARGAAAPPAGPTTLPVEPTQRADPRSKRGVEPAAATAPAPKAATFDLDNPYDGAP